LQSQGLNILEEKFKSQKDVKYVAIIQNNKPIFDYGPRNQYIDDINPLINLLTEKDGATWKISKDGNIVLIRPILSNNVDKHVGFFIMFVGEKMFSNTYKNVDLGTGSQILILNQDNTLISHSDNTFKLAQKYKDKSLITKII